jgi:hypothetical protein
MENNEFPYTRKALLMYTRYLKRWTREWKRMENSRISGVEYTEQFFKRCKAHRNYLHKVVGMAYYEDTQAYNNLSNCLMVAGGAPDAIPCITEWMAKLAEVPWPHFKLSE